MEYRKISIGEYFTEFAVCGYGQRMGDLFILFTGTEEECYSFVSSNRLDYLLEGEDEDE